MLGAYLRKHRVSKNLTQTRMAERLGTSQSYYCQIERGAKRPGFALTERIAKELGVEPSFVRGLL